MACRIVCLSHTRFRPLRQNFLKNSVALHASALVDWNNYFAADSNKCVFFHFGNWAKSCVPELEVSTAPILGTTFGEENPYGAISSRTPAGSMTFAHIETDDRHGCIRTDTGQGRFSGDPLETFGTRADVELPALPDALQTYLGWETYWHEGQR